jgi:hypothetical protein
MTQEQQALVAEIRKVFGDKGFDTTSVIGEAMFCPALATAIEAAIPNCRYRRNRRFRTTVVRRTLTDLEQIPVEFTYNLRA